MPPQGGLYPKYYNFQLLNNIFEYISVYGQLQTRDKRVYMHILTQMSAKVK